MVELIFIVALACILFVCGIMMGDSFLRWLCICFALLTVAFVVVSSFSEPTPPEASTGELIASEEIKLATIDTSNEEECYVLRDSTGMYYYITETENQFGKGHSAFEEVRLNGDDYVIIEDETSTGDAFVRIDSYDARATAESVGFKPVQIYTFMVPKGTIQFTQTLP